MRRPSIVLGGSRASWTGLAVGAPVMVFAIVGVLGADEVEIGSWGRWVVSAALFHDLLLVPVVLLVGAGLHRIVPDSAWVPLRWVLLTVGSLVLIGLPFVRRYGYQEANPTALSRQYGTGLARFCAVVGVVGIGWWLMRRRRTTPDGNDLTEASAIGPSPRTKP